MSTKSLTKVSETTGLDRLTFSDEQVELIRSQIAPKANQNELALFLHQCKRTGLDPLARQIYCIHLGGKMTIQTSIDGFRVIAERSGDYAGQDAPDFMEDGNGKLVACRVTVYRFRGEQRYPAAVGVAYMSEYSAGGPMWNKMPHTMLAKCAEAQALRKAYPQDLSGLYTMDEMEQAQPVQQFTQDVQHLEVEEVPDIEQWRGKVEECNDLPSLGAFYRQNQQAVESNPEIKSLFTERKQKLAA